MIQSILKGGNLLRELATVWPFRHVRPDIGRRADELARQVELWLLVNDRYITGDRTIIVKYRSVIICWDADAEELVVIDTQEAIDLG